MAGRFSGERPLWSGCGWRRLWRDVLPGLLELEFLGRMAGEAGRARGVGRGAGAPPADVVPRGGQEGALSAREPPSRSAGRGLQGLLRLGGGRGGVVCTDDPAGLEGMDGVVRGKQRMGWPED